MWNTPFFAINRDKLLLEYDEKCISYHESRAIVQVNSFTANISVSKVEIQLFFSDLWKGEWEKV